MIQLYKVISQSETINISRQDGTTTQKSVLVLQELGGQYANTFAAALLGNQVRFNAGDRVAAALRFTTHEYQQQHYQDVQVTEILKIASA